MANKRPKHYECKERFGGLVCNRPPREHNIRQATIGVSTGHGTVEVSQHSFKLGE